MIQAQNNSPVICNALKSFILVLKFYKGKDVYYSLESLVQNYSCNNPFTSLQKIAEEFDIIAVNCVNSSIDELKRSKYPSIIDISSDQNTKHYVLCFNFNLESGFLLIDDFDSRYYVKEEVMKTLWQNQICWIFVL